MRAVILAAGVGRRLAGFDDPKILLEVGGRTLLDRHLSILSALRIADIVIGAGYRHERIAAELARLGRSDAALVLNPAYEKGSIVTLHALGDALRGGGDVLLMDGDVLYDARILRRLLDTGHANCLLVDRAWEPGDEPVKVGVSDGHPIDFGKALAPGTDAYGESVGFFRLSEAMARRLVETAAEMIDGGQDDILFEEALRTVIRTEPAGRFGFEDITGLPWTEIDFPEDLARARAEILPRLLPGG